MKQTLFQLFSLRGIAFLWSALLSISSFGNAEPLAGGNISIAPSEPNGEWNPSRELYPGESVALQVEIASSGTDSGSEGASGGTYTLTTTKVSLERGQSLWTKTAGEDGGTSFTFEIANSGDTPARHKVGVSATWTLQGGDVAIAVVGVAGYHAGETVIGIEAKGELKASIGAEVKFSAEHDGIYSEGKGWIGDAKIPVKARFRLGNLADYELYEREFPLFDGIKSEPVRNKIYPKAS